MARPPRKPREIKRAIEPDDDAIAAPRRVDPRQADLFEFPFSLPCKPKLAHKVPVGPSAAILRATNGLTAPSSDPLRTDGLPVQCSSMLIRLNRLISSEICTGLRTKRELLARRDESFSRPET
jgi:hypothetical protein